MPKKIVNINEKIIESAVHLFSKKGYNNVKMSDIAVHSNIAVGTLYNYYKDKRSLFLVVIENQLSKLYLKLSDISHSNLSINIKELVTVLYDEISNIRGFSGELLYFSKEEEYSIKKLKNNFLFYINGLLSKDKWNREIEFVDRYHDRIIFIVLLTIINLSEEYPTEREKNIEFITDFIGKLIN